MRSLARRLVLGRLRTLESGRITVVENGSTTLVGQGAAEASLVVHDPAFYRRVLTGGSIGAAESYVAGDWSSDDLPTLLGIFARGMAATDRLDGGAVRLSAWWQRWRHWLRRNSRRGSRRNIRAHYDLSNEFFAEFLDPTMSYSCAIFEQPSATLEEASIAKIDRLCRKLDLRRGDRLLEIGTGWGALAIHAAGEYGCRVTTTTISAEQHAMARDRVAAAGLGDRVDLLLRDYRDLEGRFDKLVSVEMIEAVGHRFLPRFFGRCAELLESDGIAAVQAITMPDHRYERYRRSVDFIQAYIFPGSCLPSVAAMGAAMAAGSDLRMVHLEDITPHYAETLRRWRANLLQRAGRIQALGFPDEFLRLWDFYFAYCEAGFEERYVGDVQLLLARPGNRSVPILPELSRPAAEAIRAA